MTPVKFHSVFSTFATMIPALWTEVGGSSGKRCVRRGGVDNKVLAYLKPCEIRRSDKQPEHVRTLTRQICALMFFFFLIARKQRGGSRPSLTLRDKCAKRYDKEKKNSWRANYPQSGGVERHEVIRERERRKERE